MCVCVCVAEGGGEEYIHKSMSCFRRTRGRQQTFLICFLLHFKYIYDKVVRSRVIHFGYLHTTEKYHETPRS